MIRRPPPDRVDGRDRGGVMDLVAGVAVSRQAELIREPLPKITEKALVMFELLGEK
jgi:hypothetical protein